MLAKRSQAPATSRRAALFWHPKWKIRTHPAPQQSKDADHCEGPIDARTVALAKENTVTRVQQFAALSALAGAPGRQHGPCTGSAVSPVHGTCECAPVRVASMPRTKLASMLAGSREKRQ